MNKYAIVLKFIFVISATFAIGLSVSTAQITSLLRDRKMLLRLIGTNFVLVPLLGLVIIKLFDLSPDASIAVVLLACAPGGYNSIQFTSKVRESFAFSALCVFILSILSVFITPLLVDILGPLERAAPPPYLYMLTLITVFAMVPLAAGFIVRIKNAMIAEMLIKPATWAFNLSFIAAIIISSPSKKLAARTIGWDGLCSLIVLIIGSMIIGYLLSSAPRQTRQVLATVASMRGVTTCMLIAMYAFPDAAVTQMLLAYLMLAMPANMLFTIYHALRRKRHGTMEARHEMVQ